MYELRFKLESDLHAVIKEISASRKNVIVPLGERRNFHFLNQNNVVAFSIRPIVRCKTRFNVTNELKDQLNVHALSKNYVEVDLL